MQEDHKKLIENFTDWINELNIQFGIDYEHNLLIINEIGKFKFGSYDDTDYMYIHSIERFDSNNDSWLISFGKNNENCWCFNAHMLDNEKHSVLFTKENVSVLLDAMQKCKENNLNAVNNCVKGNVLKE